MAFWTPFFPFGLKCKALLWHRVMISLKTFAFKPKTMGSSFMKSIYIFNIFHHLRAVNETKSKVWKGKNPCPSGVNLLPICPKFCSTLLIFNFECPICKFFKNHFLTDISRNLTPEGQGFFPFHTLLLLSFTALKWWKISKM